MSFASKVLYTGDGVIKQFNIPFPFMSATHLRVFVNDTFMLNPMDYTLSGSTVTFGDAPGTDDAIVIKRETSPNVTLVDFQDGSVLNEQALDTAYLHNYYLLQETTDSFNEVINNALVNVATGAGIIEAETDAVISALVNEMINDAAASTLQQRVTDIDTNSENILQLGTDLQVQINTLAQGVAANVYVQAAEPVPGVGGIPDPILDGSRWYDSDDNNKPYIYDQGALVWVSIEDPRIGQAVADISILQTDVDGNAAAIVNEQVARSNADGAIASELGLLGAQNGAQTAFILDTSTVKIDLDTGDTFATRFSSLQATDESNSSSITTLQTVTVPAAQSAADAAQADADTLMAKYGVTLNVNGYVTGFAQNNDGTTGSFVILADKFAVVDPTGDPGEVEYVPFQIVGGKVRFNANVEIDGDLLVSGTINGQTALNAAYPIGTTLIGPNAIYSSQIAAGEVKTLNLDANAVTADKINVTNLAAVNADLGGITAGSITMNSTGFIKGGATGYATGTGFWLGYSGGYKFSVGNFSTGNYMKWDGSTLTVKGDLFVGEYATSTTTRLSATTQRSQLGGDTKKKEFTIDRAGSVNIKFDYMGDNDYTNGQVRVKKNGVTVNTTTVGNVGWTTKTVAVVGLVADDTVELWLDGGQTFTDSAEPSATYCRNVYIQCDVTIPADGGTVDLD